MAGRNLRDDFPLGRMIGKLEERPSFISAAEVSTKVSFHTWNAFQTRGAALRITYVGCLGKTSCGAITSTGEHLTTKTDADYGMDTQTSRTVE
ncbi:hypothetical protein TNCV_814801 [Trichonephila clavipes]|nr:hypothetical protein TNCV_814801 [Trichonephila clavipes]